jgi:hypothetical protein
MELLLNVLFGGATGIIGSIIGMVGKWLDNKQKMQMMTIQNSHELVLFDKQAALRSVEMENERAIADLDAWSQGRSASYDHDASYGSSDIAWVVAALRFVRPVLTVFLIILTAICFFKLKDTVSQYDLANQIVYLTSMAIAWWFGDRALGYNAGNPTKRRK